MDTDNKKEPDINGEKKINFYFCVLVLTLFFYVYP